MIIEITKKITCKDSIKCLNKFISKVEELTPLNSGDLSFGHISISHQKNNHKIWIAFYEKDNVHEQYKNNKPITVNVKDIDGEPKTRKGNLIPSALQITNKLKAL